MENKNIENKKDLKMSDKIQNRNSILKIIVVTVFSLLLAYKIGVSDLSFDFSKFDFSDLLSLIVALFSVALAVAFYFKATDTSNKFYDNTFKFTKDISEILGRIEAGFGEKLKHLDEGYSGLADKFNNGSSSSKSDKIEITKKELENEKEKLEKETKEKNEILQQLMKKAKLNSKERDDFSNKISEKDNQISNLTAELRMMKRRLIKDERMMSEQIIHSIPPDIRNRLIEFIKMEVEPEMLEDAPLDYLMSELGNKYRRMFGPRERRDFEKYGIMNENNQFTPLGIELLKNLTQRYL